MISNQTYNEIHDLRDHKRMSYRRIARRLNLDLRTTTKWAKCSQYHAQKGTTRGSILDNFKAAVRRDYEVEGSDVITIFRHLQEGGYTGGYSILKEYIRSLKRTQSTDQVKILLPSEWMQRLLQGKINARQIMAEIKGADYAKVEILVEHIRAGSLKVRNRALAVLAHLKRIPLRAIGRFLIVDYRMVSRYVHDYNQEGIAGLVTHHRAEPLKHTQPVYKDAVFTLLHSPPHDHGLNRTSWRMDDLKSVLRDQGVVINRESIRKIIKAAGFRFRSAKKVLTSTDPKYQEKLAEVTRILSTLTENQKFFSIDEFGPFAIKIQGGRALTGPGEERIVPQWQKTKGRLTLVGALELSTNQMTHFYANRKSTAEMIQLMHVLLLQYQDQSLIYLSWDAASWHASKAFIAEAARVNTEEYRSENHTPAVVLAPLPACAQFLNVIESVFSGMARAIIHNSDYASEVECKKAIDLYLAERNQFFKENPKRAGNKIWGKERVPPVFNPCNNCKDPNYR